MLEGKRALDAAMLDVGRLVAETLMYMEREERSGPDYHPTSSGFRKWASQRGSIYVGDQKLPVEHPRLRGPEGEVGLRTYEQLKNRGGFSEELLSEVLRGMSARKYEETVTAAGKAFGVTPSSVSRHLVEATAKQLKQFQERSLEEFPLFAMYLDTVHRGGQAFVVALGVDREGKKLPLGFWEGATENHEICEELLEELERRGLKLSKRILWVTDGGGGIIKALKDRYGKKLIHQRCTLHKDRNIQRHLPKRYRKQAHRYCQVDVARASRCRRHDVSVRVMPPTLLRPKRGTRDLEAVGDDALATGVVRRGRGFGQVHERTRIAGLDPEI